MRDRSSIVVAPERWMSASVCALIEKGTSWIVEARLVAVTRISLLFSASVPPAAACAKAGEDIVSSAPSEMPALKACLRIVWRFVMAHLSPFWLKRSLVAVQQRSKAVVLIQVTNSSSCCEIATGRCHTIASSGCRCAGASASGRLWPRAAAASAKRSTASES